MPQREPANAMRHMDNAMASSSYLAAIICDLEVNVTSQIIRGFSGKPDDRDEAIQPGVLELGIAGDKCGILLLGERGSETIGICYRMGGF